jgi:hypothetical protein
VKTYKYHNSAIFQACFYGLLFEALGLFLFIYGLSAYSKGTDKIDSLIRIVFGSLFAIAGLVISLDNVIHKYGKKICIGDDGIILPKEKLLLWSQIKKLEEGNAVLASVYGKIFSWQKEKYNKKKDDSKQNIGAATRKEKSFTVWYIDESGWFTDVLGFKIKAYVFNDDIENYADFKRLVYEKYRKHKEPYNP